MSDIKSILDQALSEGRDETIELSTPWGNQNIHCGDRGSVFSRTTQTEFIKERTRVHETFIQETAKNRRLGLVLAFILLLSAVAVVLFAPDGRETVSYWAGIALIIFAAGASGYGRIWGNVYSVSFGAEQNKKSDG